MATILALNAAKGRGLPNPYYEPEDAMRLISGMDPINPEIFSGHSYALEALVEFLARRLSKRSLAHFWEKITRLQFTWFRPGNDSEWFRWKAESGSLDHRTPNMPQHWATLLNAAESEPIGIPKFLKDRPPFVVFFCLVFPHRFGVALLRLIEHAIQEAPSSKSVEQVFVAGET